MFRIIKSKKVVVTAVAVVAISFGVGAYAWFSSAGEGSGSAAVGDATAWDVTSDAYQGDPLTPDGPTQTIDYRVKNTNSGTQKLFNVAISVANADGSAWSSGSCSKDDFSLNGAAAGATIDPFADANASGLSILSGAQWDDTISIQMVDTGLDQDDCKNVTVPLYFSAS